MRGLLFDFNGVLLDDEGLHCRFLRETLAAEGISLSERDYYEVYLGFDDRGCFERALAGAGRAPTAERVAELIARKARRYAAHVEAHGAPFFAGSRELLDQALAARLPVGIVSGALRAEIEGALRHSGFTDPLGRLERLAGVIAAEDVVEGKPDPEGYRKGLAMLVAASGGGELAPTEVVALEDSPAGIESALAAGLRVVGVGHTYPPERLARAHAVVPALAGFDLAQLRMLLAATP